MIATYPSVVEPNSYLLDVPKQLVSTNTLHKKLVKAEHKWYPLLL